jgi:hypothetical protein
MENKKRGFGQDSQLGVCTHVFPHCVIETPEGKVSWAYSNAVFDSSTSEFTCDKRLFPGALMTAIGAFEC